MSTSNARDAANWAPKVERLTVPAAASAHGYNIEGKRVAGPQQGFGRLWQRTYRADLGAAVAPETVVADWRANFGAYWPKVARFYGTSASIQPGDVAPLEAPGFASGVLVIYADDTSFTFLTPEGHLFAALITFSAEETGTDAADGGRTVAQIRILLRCSDPIFESMWAFIRPGESFMWRSVLRKLAAAHGVAEVVVTEETECVDRRRLWRNWRNIRDNSGIRMVWHVATTPFRGRAQAS